MKANQKFIRRSDDAVSPVIAVILMVAITVVLAATVYVWVSGFGASGSQAKTASFSVTSSGGWAALSLVSSSANLNWNNVKITVSGYSGTDYGIAVIDDAAAFSSFINNAAWDGGTHLSATSRTATAGDIIRFGVDTTPTTTITLNVVDKSSNTVMATVTIPSLTGLTPVTDGIASCVDSTDTVTFTTSTNGYYSKTGTDTVLIQQGNLLDNGGAVAAGTHSGISATTFTGATGIANTETWTFDASEIYDIAGNALTGTQVCTA